MAARFASLVLLAQLHDLPQAYSTKIKTYGVEGDITAQQHLDRFNDFCDLEEVDDEDAKLRLFAQSFSGEAKKWLPWGYDCHDLFQILSANRSIFRIRYGAITWSVMLHKSIPDLSLV
jgi:hypothetical protein